MLLHVTSQPAKQSIASNVLIAAGVVVVVSGVAKACSKWYTHIQIANETRTPLHAAARAGNRRALEFFINRGADIHAVDEDGEKLGDQLLREAAFGGSPKVLKFFIDHNADINARDKCGSTPLHEAARRGKLKMATLLIGSEADKNARDKDGWTPLHWAATGGNLEVLKLLIGSGADINAVDQWKGTPLHWAATVGNLEALKFLIESEADINAVDLWKRTPLHKAVSGGNLEVLKFLVRSGADINSIDQREETPLHEAASKGNPEALKFLIESGTRISTNDINPALSTFHEDYLANTGKNERQYSIDEYKEYLKECILRERRDEFYQVINNEDCEIVDDYVCVDTCKVIFEFVEVSDEDLVKTAARFYKVKNRFLNYIIKIVKRYITSNP